MRTAPFSLGIISLSLAVTGATPGLADVYTVTTQDCRQIVTHVPADDVAYVPGVDVSGNPVVPADLGGGYGITAPEEVTINIRLDLAEQLGLGGEDGGIAAATIGGEAVVGQVTVRDNDIYWNGRKIPRDSHAVLAASCGDAFTAACLPLPIPKPAMD